MLKELVDFSRELEKNGIYDRIEESQQKIDKPIMVIPVKDDLSDIDTENIYFVVKDTKKELVNGVIKYLIIFDDQKQPVEVKNIDAFNKIMFKELKTERMEWQKVILDFDNYTWKLSDDPKGNKSIGTKGNNGTNSYHILAFTGSFETRKIFSGKNEFIKKIENTYRDKKVIQSGLMINDYSKVEKISCLLEKICRENSINLIWKNIENFKEIMLNNKDKYSIDNIKVLIKLPESYYSFYRVLHDRYIDIKSFKDEKEVLHYQKPVCCNICGNISNEMSIPSSFNNFSTKKKFVQHRSRMSLQNDEVCRNCAKLVCLFHYFVLEKTRLRYFPLFIKESDQGKSIGETISLMKQSKNIDKLGFKEIIKQVYQKTFRDVLDFYLIIYNAQARVISFDYITGFKFKQKGMDLFQIEDILGNHFFDMYSNTGKSYNGKLRNNYFTENVRTENIKLDHLIYEYRTNIFDYVFRANYKAFTQEKLLNIFLRSFERKYRDYFNPKIDNKNIDVSIHEMLDAYKKLDIYFETKKGGNFMETVKRIRGEGKIHDSASFSYFAGQIVYYLLQLSETKNKTHSLLEPFINIRNISVFMIRIEELIKAYKHNCSFENDDINQFISDCWSYMSDHRGDVITDEMRALFYAGYFASYENVFKNYFKS